MILNGDKILLKNISEKTTGGIVIAANVQIPYTLYEVVGMGPGVYCEATGDYIKGEVKIGDRVLVNCGVAQEINVSVDGVKTKYYIVDSVEECAIILDEDEGI